MTPLPHIDGMTHRDVDVGGGVRLHVAEIGEGPPVLLLHGWPQHWWAWRKVAPLLAAGGYRAICPDLRGFGWSDAPPGAYDKVSLGEDLIALLDALEIDRTDLIGHDWGGWIGFRLCLDHPERFRHYLALNIYTPWPVKPPRGASILPRLWYQVMISTPGVGAALIRRTDFVKRLITAGAVHRDAWSDDDLEAFAAPLREPARARASVRLYRTFLLREMLPYARGQFNGHRLTVPTRILHGKRDLAVSHKFLGNWRAHADDMDVELRDDSGHFILEELPELVAERARALFARD
jgi:pimeloyl-ACP methyl ester carboxylesterase